MSKTIKNRQIGKGVSRLEAITFLREYSKIRYPILLSLGDSELYDIFVAFGGNKKVQPNRDNVTVTTIKLSDYCKLAELFKILNLDLFKYIEHEVIGNSENVLLVDLAVKEQSFFSVLRINKIEYVFKDGKEKDNS